MEDILKRQLWLYVMPLAVLSLSSFFDFENLYIELSSHFVLQYAVAAFLLLSLSIKLYQKKLVFIYAVILIANSYQLLHFYFPQADIKAPENAQTFSLMVANVNSSNRSFADFYNLLQQIKPDLLLVLEVSPEWEDSFGKLDEVFASKIGRSSYGNFGMYFFSRYKFISAELVSDTPVADVPYADVTVEVNQKKLRILGIHPQPPLSFAKAEVRDDLLLHLGKLRKDNQATVLLGDFNTTYFRYTFRELLTNSDFRDARKGRGCLATWPSFLFGLGIPIDHILVSPELKVVDVDVISIPGSDHRGLIAKVSM